ncbi:MAG: RnfABCDGE type electron transport complex subunit D [Patescibacteria group bacterium]|nr:RnfABCDGE type electron transport complex subunit D [Patescibacteria group bacterium]
MIKEIDRYLNNTTMYRLTLNYLVLILLAALFLSALGFLPFSPLALAFSAAFLVGASFLANSVFARVFEAPKNLESVYITALILSLIISPAKSGGDLVFLFWAAVLSMASKYILAKNRKHFFNPAALSVAVTALTINHSASWWVGSQAILPFVLVGGLLIVRKLRRSLLVAAFLITAAAFLALLGLLRGSSPLDVLSRALLDSPLVFFACVMLTEPLTTPPTKNLQILYGALVGFLFPPPVHLGALYSTPELALVAGNIFSYLASPKGKLTLILKDKVEVAKNVYDFVFYSPKQPAFSPGQYMEWTLPHPSIDARGNRRYFTLASSPTEKFLRIGVKFYSPPSSFKEALMALNPGAKVTAGSLAGDFTLPKDKTRKLVFIAGGIGVTPFRSMVRYLLDKREKRPVTLIYSASSAKDFAYTSLFDQAREKIGLRVYYTITDSNVPSGWPGGRGFLMAEDIKRKAPDFKESLFYLSGPHALVDSFNYILKGLGVASGNIKTDFFPGFV